ncbi:MULTISPECIES: hypothetical protein [unclassified Streptomyces]|uniref:hypothetical protein n=1 Tax=unclassified Streptomyces TaxID=2593676 RepID=UPI00093C63BC|nr:hypothetical protein [Streptomyces sp. CB01580]OKJ27974.1 hypothetical protein AMK22_29075 [Streptomyces sp. CB01580]
MLKRALPDCIEADGIARSLDMMTRAEADFLALGALVRGRGLDWGIAFAAPDLGARISHEAYLRGLLVETSGSADEVAKLLPPLTASRDELAEGVALLADAVTRQSRRPLVRRPAPIGGVQGADAFLGVVRSCF